MTRTNEHDSFDIRRKLTFNDAVDLYPKIDWLDVGALFLILKIRVSKTEHKKLPGNLPHVSKPSTSLMNPFFHLR